MRDMGKPRAAEAGGTVTRLFNRLFLSTRTGAKRLPNRRAEAFVGQTVAAPASSGATAQPSNSSTVVDTSVGRRQRLEKQLHRESSSGNDSEVFGYSSAEQFSSRFELGEEIAKGGNGVVRLLVERRTGEKYACKTLPKKLHEAGPALVSEAKMKGHVDAIKREVDVLWRLEGSLDVARLDTVYEDNTHVHMVMEYCTGGELWHAIGNSHYSERTVASYMRAVLRTLAQCHSHGILHRDIKPGNFLLLNNSPHAPLKAIDFGLAVPFEAGSLPRRDLGLEGTPWYMAPEVLSSAVTPASDLWSAGVMAYQLLSGRLPFNDRRSPSSPSITVIWQQILKGKADFSGSTWANISDEGKDFVRSLLQTDPAKRPSAREAMRHPFLAKRTKEDRSTGRHLGMKVLKRIQRYGQSTLFKRTVLELIAEDLLALPQSESDECRVDDDMKPVFSDVHDCALEYLYSVLSFDEGDVIDHKQLEDGLKRIGYNKLEANELERLLGQLDPGRSGRVAKSQFAASQLDWRLAQLHHRERWLAAARQAFTAFDTNADGLIDVANITQTLRTKLPPDEVAKAVRRGMADAQAKQAIASQAAGALPRSGSAPEQGIDFDTFLAMLRSHSLDSLDLYDDRSGSSRGSSLRAGCGVAGLLERSIQGADHYKAALQPVAETK